MDFQNTHHINIIKYYDNIHKSLTHQIRWSDEGTLTNLE